MWAEMLLLVKTFYLGFWGYLRTLYTRNMTTIESRTPARPHATIAIALSLLLCVNQHVYWYAEDFRTAAIIVSHW